MAERLTVFYLRDYLADVLAEAYKDYELETACTTFGIPDPPNRPQYNSKRVYVRHRLSSVRLPEMITIAERIAEDLGHDELEELIRGPGLRGVDGEMKNIIFAAEGNKPRIVLRDAIDNVIEIVEGADRVLVYDRPLSRNGLTRRELVEWWAATAHDPGPEGLLPQRTLGSRLARSLGSDAEKVVFRAYRRRFANAEDADNAPALIPQVYLHYDPYTRRELETMEGGELARQRMDFLVLLPDWRRVVIEVDGKHHYAVHPYTSEAKPSPRLYAEMVAEDRRIRLAGYEVFRFGAYELMQDDGEDVVDRFFDQLLV